MSDSRQWEINSSQAWARLFQHQRATRHLHMRELFENDPQRFERFSLRMPHLLFDYSKNRVTDRTLELLVDLAETARLQEWMQRMGSGDAINVSENRAVLHTALRLPAGSQLLLDGEDVVAQVQQQLAQMAAFSAQVRQRQWCGASGESITNIVNIGIGGSDLGPQMVAEALAPYADPGLSLHFVSNVDGAHLAGTLQRLEPARTLFIVASKSFTTPETLLNARAARHWLTAALGEAAVARHFVAISANARAVREFGIGDEQRFQLWDWVGGRFSVCSSIGLPVMLAIGHQHFCEFLAGAHALDQHFFTAPFRHNAPVLMALIGIWYNTFYQAHTHAIMPYDHGLRRLPAHVQQLDMESNGKRVGRYGEPIDFDTGPVIWGEEGVNSQHAFFQLLHQGTRLVPCDFIVPMRSHYPASGQHPVLVANCLAQTRALMRGKTESEVLSEMAGVSGDRLDMLLPQKTFPGNQPSNTLAFDQLTPYTMGMLLALYEHKVFVQGVIWGINSFDQWGVEYGKALASDILPELAADSWPAYDSSTNGLIDFFRSEHE